VGFAVGVAVGFALGDAVGFAVGRFAGMAQQVLKWILLSQLLSW
jgi:hypothetical protein